jgi:hypothetical protein
LVDGRKGKSGLNVWGTSKNISKYDSVGNLEVLEELQKPSPV